MSLRDFAARRVRVPVAGGIITCRPPTLETVRLFLELFSAELGALTSIGKDAFDSLGPSPADTLIPFFADEDRAKAVLETCCDADWQIFAVAKKDDLIACYRAVIGLCDIRRVIASLDLGGEEGATAPAGPDPHDEALVVLGEKFGVSPLSIMQWNYEAFLTVCETLKQINEERRREAELMAGGGERPYLDASRAALMGIPIGTVERA